MSCEESEGEHRGGVSRLRARARASSSTGESSVRSSRMSFRLMWKFLSFFLAALLRFSTSKESSAWFEFIAVVCILSRSGQNRNSGFMIVRLTGDESSFL